MNVHKAVVKSRDTITGATVHFVDEIYENLFNEISYNTMQEKLNFAINRFSKRQMTFFRRMEKRGLKIHWMKKNNPNLNNLINNFLHS